MLRIVVRMGMAIARRFSAAVALVTDIGSNVPSIVF